MLAGMPAIVLTLGGIFLPDTPNSLIQRGMDAQGRAVLVRIRGTTDVDEEFNDIKDAVKQSESVSPGTARVLKGRATGAAFCPVALKVHLVESRSTGEIRAAPCQQASKRRHRRGVERHQGSSGERAPPSQSLNPKP